MYRGDILMKDLNYYINLNYTMEIKKEKDFDGVTDYYIANYKELDGLVGTGDTLEAAIDDLKEIEKDWFQMCIDMNINIPEPIVQYENKPVKITYRIPNILNDQLEIYMRNQNVSKNNAITMLIQSGLYNNKIEETESTYQRFIGMIYNYMNINRKPRKILEQQADTLIKKDKHLNHSRYISPSDVVFN
ncbi:hypothetical protein QI336_02275 [Staphylococcus saprophyticus]|uniref:type II toxin-antitoxin system HicB family antitoxin n=2 Tax=Staphylococcus TaxID=1279 RepID=UPI00114C90AB|nr:hypothetical protein [Staphylococcus saprophyticus]MDW3837868.1 hypothetical protein [Staphylococcus saprophyticus]MDW4104039.1 hypothetical protein [Staphylococcus saprophyticus]